MFRCGRCFCCIVRSTAPYYYTIAIDVWLMVLRKTDTIDPPRIHLFGVWLMGACVSPPDTIESSRIHLFVWCLINDFGSSASLHLIDLVTVSVWLMGWMLTGVDFCLFVRRLRDVISNESILVLKENKHNFYSFQHIFIQHNSNYFNFLINLSIIRSFIIGLSVKAHTILCISCP